MSNQSSTTATCKSKKNPFEPLSRNGNNHPKFMNRNTACDSSIVIFSKSDVKPCIWNVKQASRQMKRTFDSNCSYYENLLDNGFRISTRNYRRMEDK